MLLALIKILWHIFTQAVLLDANNRATEAENSTPEENPRSSTQRVPLQDPCTSAEATASIDALTSQGPTSPIENASTSHNR